MGTLVIRTQLLSGLADTLHTIVLTAGLTVHHCLRPFEQAVFLSLSALAVLPRSGTDSGTRIGKRNYDESQPIILRWARALTYAMWLQPVFNSITRRQAKHLCHSSLAAVCMSSSKTSSCGQGPK